ncbi:unnamed protein product [Ceratitis capitata]|uniref:(Mediterranean fruit fly) hypothetical protein n=1 Tax=Ceratitis capitata TaxID=7213 RepID=A0A811TZF1_CERCA|nr:unnamed protein product [Ceratitis capitata]
MTDTATPKSKLTVTVTVTATAHQTTVLAAEDDNCELNELELCRCCGKPNVTLYDLFPKASTTSTSAAPVAADNVDSSEVDVSVNMNADNMATSVIDENEKLTSSVVDILADDNPNNTDGEIMHKTATAVVDLSDATKTNVSTKIDDNAGTNTPKRCYRTIAASIAAAAAASGTSSNTSNKTTGLCSDGGAPTCEEKLNDPISVAAAAATAVTVAATNGDDVADDRSIYGEGARVAAATRVKKSETNQNAVGAPNNNAEGQNSDNMENILQEMEIWQLRA